MRGEGNHKIPGSFAPENMEKTGAERVKYSLACQHEDAIPIKFVSYAQKCPTVLCTFAVALRKESVDRNSIAVSKVASVCKSLSARRAWIEICPHFVSTCSNYVALRKESVDRNVNLRVVDGSKSVALRKESVDRNFYYADKDADWVRSLSARRAWIEMEEEMEEESTVEEVALRKESVDRNSCRACRSGWLLGRSPQGERG